MRPAWESGLRGRIYALGRRLVPLSLRRAVRRRLSPERLLGIHKPRIAVNWQPLDTGAPRSGVEDIVILPVIAWSYRRQRPQQLAEALARRGRRVFYGSVEGEGEPREPVGAAPGVTLLPIAGPRREDLPSRRLGGAVLERALAGLAAARERFGLASAVLLVQSPFWSPLAVKAREQWGWRIVYDCLDAHGGFATNRKDVLDTAEEEIARHADIVAATSEPLRRRLEAWNPSCRLLPNACDFALFSAVPAPRGHDGPLVVGYAGAVDAWFDGDLVDRLATLAPDWKFEIVGGFEGGARAGAPRSNVTYHGERPYSEMPAFRARFDVEMIPFRLTPLTHATDPVKLYEAAASGRTVVATPMESLRPFARRGLVRLAATAEDFRREISAAAADRIAAADRQRRFARENTWDARAAVLDSWIVNLANQAGGTQRPPDPANQAGGTQRPPNPLGNARRLA
jgi:glycosyltransferase involved in cell wall biosynthesis